MKAIVRPFHTCLFHFDLQGFSLFFCVFVGRLNVWGWSVRLKLIFYRVQFTETTENYLLHSNIYYNLTLSLTFFLSLSLSLSIYISIYLSIYLSIFSRSLSFSLSSIFYIYLSIFLSLSFYIFYFWIFIACVDYDCEEDYFGFLFAQVSCWKII